MNFVMVDLHVSVLWKRRHGNVVMARGFIHKFFVRAPEQFSRKRLSRTRSETHADAAALLPHDPAGFLDAAVVEDEFLRNGIVAVHVEASAAGAEIDNAASGGAAFQINKQRAGLGHQSCRPDTMVASMLAHFLNRSSLPGSDPNGGI
jgi:hypothetical protein